MAVIYHEEDGDLQSLGGRRVSILGYGNLGRPLALNLRDSGVAVHVGAADAERGATARAEGFQTRSIAEAVQESRIIFMTMPDEVMAQVYLEQVSPHLRSGDMLVFASGYNVAFGFIEAPPFVDVGLIAPRTLGVAVRERYLSGEGFYSFVAVGQEASGRAWPTLLALAKAVGSLRAGAVEISLEQEAELDLFIQQAILPAVHHIMVTASQLLLRLGYPPEAALTDLYLSGEFTDYLQRAADSGLLHALRLSSLTSQYGIFSRLERFSELKLERLMEITLEQIQSGDFSQEWAREYAGGYPRLQKLIRAQEIMDLWELEQQTLEMLNRY
jgi:ketol-acid reductoisomerase